MNCNSCQYWQIDNKTDVSQCNCNQLSIVGSPNLVPQAGLGGVTIGKEGIQGGIIYTHKYFGCVNYMPINTVIKELLNIAKNSWGELCIQSKN